ncbi:MAG: peptidylprolyl isomerase [Desulfobacterales bacterium]|nr:peptidylprolyl isomerase [Desulfobacterales bacterium]
MKRFFPLVFIFFLLMLSSASGKVVDQVVGVVDGDVITLSELNDAMPLYGKANILAEGNPLDKEIRLRQARKEILEQLVEEKLLQRVASRYGIKVEDAEIDKTIERMKQEGSMSDAQVKKDLAAHGFTMEGYRHLLTVQLRRVKIIDALIKPDVSMAEEKLREYYQSHAGNYIYPEVRVSQIVIQVPPEPKPKDWEIAKKKMEKVLQGLKKGATFGKMAALYSDDAASAHSGGDLGFFSKGEMIPTLEEVVFKMEVGAVSGVIQSSQGLHLLKVTDKKPGAMTSFEEAKPRVMADYYQEEVTRLYVKWLQDLKARSNVEIKL